MIKKRTRMSFSKGIKNLTLGNADKFWSEVMEALGTENKNSTERRLKDGTFSPVEANAINEIFQSHGVKKPYEILK